MNTDNNKENGWQSEGESLNTGSASGSEKEQNQQHNKNEGQTGSIHNNALFAASMGRSAVGAVDPHSSADMEQTGTNPAYENAIGEGAGGSAGTGFTSGKEGYDVSNTPEGITATGNEDILRQQADDAADEEE